MSDPLDVQRNLDHCMRNIKDAGEAMAGDMHGAAMRLGVAAMILASATHAGAQARCRANARTAATGRRGSTRRSLSGPRGGRLSADSRHRGADELLRLVGTTRGAEKQQDRRVGYGVGQNAGNQDIRTQITRRAAAYDNGSLWRKSIPIPGRRL